MKKNFLEFAALLVLWIALECIVFNFDATKARFVQPDQNYFDLRQEEMTQINWIQDGDRLVSEEDPQLIFEDLGQYVGQITISYESSKPINDIAVFYTTDEAQEFGAELLVQNLQPEEGGTTLKIDSYVKDLRVDLGDESGISFENIYIRVEPLTIQMSFSRLVAILFIFYMSKLLFAIQAPLDFGFDLENESN